MAESKFKVGDEVLIIEFNIIQKGEVIDLEANVIADRPIRVRWKDRDIGYLNTDLDRSRVYTKQELLKMIEEL